MGKGNLNIEELFYAIKKRIVFILIITFAFTMVGFFMANKNLQVKYRATAKIFAGKIEEIQSTYSSKELSEHKELLDAYVDIINTDNFYNRVLSTYGIAKNASQVKGSVSFTQLKSAPILQISYTSTNQAEAMAIVTAIANEFSTEVQTFILNTHIKVIEEAKCATIMPDKMKVILIAFMGGLISSLGIVFILDYLDKTIRSKEELEKILNVPVLGEIPNYTA